MYKRMAALVLVMCLAWAVLPIGAFARQQGQTLDGFLQDLAALTGQYGPGQGEGPYAAARILVKCDGGLADLGDVAHLRWQDWHVLQYESAQQAQAAAEYYEALGYAVDADHVVSACDAGEETAFYSWGYGQDYVNAAALQQRILDKVGGDVSQLPEILVGVVDSGLDTSNPIFADRVVAGYDAVSYDDTTEEGTYHGTHVSSTIAEGTLSNVKLMPIKVLDSDGLGYYSTFAFGMRYAVEHGCRVVNLSLGDKCYFDSTHQAFVDAVQEGHQKGVVFCVASGNFKGNADDYCPANVEGVITVAAHDACRQLSYYSNVGSCVDITAPGVSILGAHRDGSVKALTGTSMATPHVTAVCALILSYDQSLTSEEVRQLICDNAAPSDIEGGGAGLLCATGIFAEETAEAAEKATSGWYFESEAELADWSCDDWVLVMRPDVTALHGKGSLVGSASGISLASPTFTAGQALCFAVSTDRYGADAGQIAVSLSSDGGASFGEPVAIFQVTAQAQLCRVDLSAYTGQQICVRFEVQACPEDTSMILDAVELYGGDMEAITLTFRSNAQEEALAVLTVPGGTAISQELFPQLPAYTDRSFCGWDYDGSRLYEDATVTARFTDPNTQGWDFEEDPLSIGWITRDADADGNDWFWYQKGADKTTVPQGEGMMCSYSYDQVSLDPDNWLISPLFTAGEQLQFSMVAFNWLLTAETVGVYVSADGGQTWSEELGYFTAAEEVQVFTVDTTAYQGQCIQVAFRHYDDPRQNAVGIDDVQILGERTAPAPVSSWEPIAVAAMVIVALVGVITLLVLRKKKSKATENE